MDSRNYNGRMVAVLFVVVLIIIGLIGIIKNTKKVSADVFIKGGLTETNSLY